ncbi:hypothetical protein M422DRAFT_177276 [Sphaerobolus stellatus SS14]|uniref:Uncharacterized protein n=1 Tax=Sphaerobolus stellatus (strain SS14) TaxID=990650 RepID=A0A0C9VKD2_SPHS4|nr:hypothetical protein M422DRAFT_177276 [Sphaerobolus stellatus SS14]
MLLWINNSLTPQEIQERLMSKDSEFQKEIIGYFESMHQGEFIDTTLEEVKCYLNAVEKDPEYAPPTMVLPDPAPDCKCLECQGDGECHIVHSWWEKFRTRVNDILACTNIHQCKNVWLEKCKARFPREYRTETAVDQEGHIFFRHMEPNLNTITSALTYMLGCNTDVSNLQSGTSIKAVLMYITDYITKILSSYIVYFK